MPVGRVLGNPGRTLCVPATGSSGAGRQLLACRIGSAIPSKTPSIFEVTCPGPYIWWLVKPTRQAVRSGTQPFGWGSLP
jgi:hypothetical protein